MFNKRAFANPVASWNGGPNQGFGNSRKDVIRRTRCRGRRRIGRRGLAGMGTAIWGACYMPALTSVRWESHLKAFCQKLLGRQKNKLQALTAVGRKRLYAIFCIFKTNTPYDGAKLFPTAPAS